ncbi:MAG TPA: hypothetical protein VK919_14585, partial [Solirubrobacterales bacterium]|nr:hypothetical protein [Solirubrobacterales bacterium]
MNHSAIRPWKLPATVGIACVIASLLVVALTQAAPSTQLVSRNSGGGAADADSTLPVGTALSRDGNLIAFDSQASNLPGGDGAIPQVYVRNVNARKTRLVSVNAAGEPATSFVYSTGISADGRFVGFSGHGGGLPGANGQTQVWVHDRKTRRTVLASRTAGGEPADAGSSGGTLSADGRWIAFDSSATNLPGAGSSSPAVYLHDRKRKRTLRVSRANGGAPATGYVYGQAISADGTRVAFYSVDGSLPGADGSTYHVYVRDRKRGRTILVDRAAGGAVADAASYNPSISANGRFVIFESQATNLPGAGASSNQVYVRDLKRGRTRLVGRNSAGQPQT